MTPPHRQGVSQPTAFPGANETQNEHFRPKSWPLRRWPSPAAQAAQPGTRPTNKAFCDANFRTSLKGTKRGLQGGRYHVHKNQRRRVIKTAVPPNLRPRAGRPSGPGSGARGPGRAVGDARALRARPHRLFHAPRHRGGTSRTSHSRRRRRPRGPPPARPWGKQLWPCPARTAGTAHPEQALRGPLTSVTRGCRISASGVIRGMSMWICRERKETVTADATSALRW